MCKTKKKSKVKRGDIRYNYRHGHLAHVKKVYNDHGIDKATSVFMSTKESDAGKANIKMNKSIKVFNSTDNSYFIKRVRSFPTSTYSKDKVKDKLSIKDKLISNKIYKKHLRNVKKKK